MKRNSGRQLNGKQGGISRSATPQTIRQRILRKLPGVDILLQEKKLLELQNKYPRSIVVRSIQYTLQDLRERIRTLPLDVISEEMVSPERLLEEVQGKVNELNRYRLKRVINATGVVVHTNLGRSLLAKEAIDRMVEVSQSYSNLEYDLEHGKRGSRAVHVEDLLRDLCGAEAALVVNNNAAAVSLALNTLARDKEVIVSRGELVEIGGSFRIPDIIDRSGAVLVEAGTTNRTRITDYEEAITPDTALILKVHTSNYRMVGFVQEATLSELVDLGRRHQIPVMNDLGSGALLDLSSFGYQDEPSVKEVMKSGVDLVTFSGDKLLGGPQGGILVGEEPVLSSIKKNPLHRAMRVDKLTLAALEATLRLYLDPGQALERIPTLRYLTRPEESVGQQANEFAQRIHRKKPNHLTAEVKTESSRVGGGAYPLHLVPTRVVSLHSDLHSASEIEEWLRMYDPPIIVRIRNEEVLMDFRTVEEQDLPILEAAISDLDNK